MQRVQKSYVLKDLAKKMVILAGPRQVGKTTLAKQIAEEFQHPTYLNYDGYEDRIIIDDQAWLENTDLLILDELHKMPNWKNYLKGLYDTKPDDLKILVTGSARLSVYEQMGDSLAGRYFAHHLMPLSIAELNQLKQPLDTSRLMTHSGFPEPYLSGTLIDVHRWRTQYTDSLIRTDVLDFENINNLRALQTVFELLRSKVGSPISYQSIAEDIGVSHATVKKYVSILESLYIVFRVTPFSKNIARSLLKEPKIYFFDTGLIKGDEGQQFENMLACSLLKHAYALNDYEGRRIKIHYLRTKDKQEVDFVITENETVLQMIEAKNKDNTLSSSLKLFANRYGLPAVQVVNHLQKEKQIDSIKIVKALNFLKELFL